jgi:uncharacterized protein YcbK (DUF882 family)
MYTITDEELAAIVVDVKRELDKGAEAAIAQLNKSNSDDTEGQEDSPADVSPASPPVDSSPAASAPVSPAADASAAPASPPVDASASPAADPVAAPVDSAETLAADYGSLSPEDFQMHLQAMKMAASQKGMDLASMLAPAVASPAPVSPVAASPAPASPMDASAALASPAASASPAPVSPVAASPDPLAALKSEHEVEMASLRKNQDSMESQLAAMAETLKKVFAQPLSKAVTSVSELGFIAKPGTVTDDKQPEKTFTQAEILSGLRKAARNSELKKSDRELIDRYVEKKATFEQIKHLLG